MECVTSMLYPLDVIQTKYIATYFADHAMLATPNVHILKHVSKRNSIGYDAYKLLVQYSQ